MAERRMFTKKITESDAFLDMPSSTQMLYFHLSMNADDDGFVNNPKRIQRVCGASDDDFKLLVAKSFVIMFDSGIIVIKHWRMHNYIQNDRYKLTDYIDEYSMLGIKKNKAYTLDENKMETKCIQNVHLGKDSIGKDRLVEDRLDKVSIDKDREKEKERETFTNVNAKRKSKFIPPKVSDVEQYCLENNKDIDAQAFVDFYESKGWMIGKNKMVSWKSAVNTWERHGKSQRQDKRSEFDDWRNA